MLQPSPPLIIFHSLSALQRWQNGTQMGQRLQQSRRRCIPAQHRRHALLILEMTRSPILQNTHCSSCVAAAVWRMLCYIPLQEIQPKVGNKYCTLSANLIPKVSENCFIGGNLHIPPLRLINVLHRKKAALLLHSANCCQTFHDTLSPL